MSWIVTIASLFLTACMAAMGLSMAAGRPAIDLEEEQPLARRDDAGHEEAPGVLPALD